MNTRFYTVLPLVLLVVGTALAAQTSDKKAMAVYPFGASPDAPPMTRALTGPASTRAIAGIQATGRLEAKDSTASAAIQNEVNKAKSIGEFESTVQIKTDEQLQTSYVFQGFIESADVKAGAPDKSGRRLYTATVRLSVLIHDVQHATVIDTKTIEVTNTVASVVHEQACTGNRLQVAVCERLKGTSGGAIDSATKRLPGNDDDTPQKALASAINNVTSAVTDFINNSFATGKLK